MWMLCRDLESITFTISGHKIHGPKGIGVLYIDEHVKIKPIVFGGEQQKNVRSGTENVPGIAGIGLAAKMIYENLDEKVAAMRAMKEHFIEGVKQIPDTTIHGLYDETSAPHIISVGFAGIRSEVLLHALEDKGIQRFCMCFQPSADQRCVKRNRSRSAVFGCNA